MKKSREKKKKIQEQVKKKTHVGGLLSSENIIPSNPLFRGASINSTSVS